MNILSNLALAFVGVMMIEATRIAFMSAMSSLDQVELSYRDLRMALPLLKSAFQFAIAALIWSLLAASMKGLGLQFLFVLITMMFGSWNMVMFPKGLSNSRFAFRVIMLNGIFVLGIVVAHI